MGTKKGGVHGYAGGGGRGPWALKGGARVCRGYAAGMPGWVGQYGPIRPNPNTSKYGPIRPLGHNPLFVEHRMNTNRFPTLFAPRPVGHYPLVVETTMKTTGVPTLSAPRPVDHKHLLVEHTMETCGFTTFSAPRSVGHNHLFC